MADTLKITRKILENIVENTINEVMNDLRPSYSENGWFTPEQEAEVMAMIEKMEEDDDIEAVYHNIA